MKMTGLFYEQWQLVNAIQYYRLTHYNQLIASYLCMFKKIIYSKTMNVDITVKMNDISTGNHRGIIYNSMLETM